jgi:hypothetical protein
MDQLAVLIARHGIEASVHNHAEAEAVVGEIAARYGAGDRGPIITSKIRLDRGQQYSY